MAETVDIANLLRTAAAAHRAGRLAEAERGYRQVLAAMPDHPVALNLLGVIGRQSGHVDVAVKLLQRAAAVAPEYPDAHYNLGNALKDQGKPHEAAAAYRRALALKPQTAGWHNNLGAALQDAGDLDAAAAAYREAAAWDPAYADPHNNLGNVLQQQGRGDEAIAAYRRAVEINPQFTGALGNLGAALLKSSRAQDALDAMERVLAIEPQNARAVAYKAVALRLLGRHAEADVLEDVNRLVGRDRPVPPAGFPDLDAFNRQLIADIRAHPSLTEQWDPAKRAARGGAVALHLLAHKTLSIAGLERMARGAIDAFAARLPHDPTHPFLMRKPRRYALNMWANILAEEGHQAAHIHNLGWLSGVYYPYIPPVVRDDDPERQGWIEFGRPGYGLPERFDLRIHAIRPETGLVLMFPSSFWHRTIPFRGAPERISVAFDLHVLE